MQPFSFEEKIDIKVTPNQIHKIMDKLKNEIIRLKYRGDGDITTYSLSKAQITDTSVDELEIIYKNKFVDNFKFQKLLYEYTSDLLSMKEEPFSFNVTSRVSKKLSQIEILKNLIKYYSIFKESNSSSTDTRKTLLKAKSFLENCDSEVQNVDMSIIFYEYEDVKKLMRNSRVEILSLEKEITILNATKDIDISISKNSAEFLGLR